MSHKLQKIQGTKELNLPTQKQQLYRFKRKSLTPGILRHCMNDDWKKKKVRIYREKRENCREKEEKRSSANLNRRGACRKWLEVLKILFIYYRQKPLGPVKCTHMASTFSKFSSPDK